MTQERMKGAVAVRQAIRGCEKCSLRLEASEPVPWSGPLSPHVAILGEAPGRIEDRENAPFIGPAGQFLRGVLTKAGIPPTEVAFINSANCWPSVTHTPTKEHLDACRVHLVGQLAAVLPEYLIVVGTTAFSAVFGTELKLRDIRGRPCYVDQLEPWPPFSRPLTVWCTYHPAARKPTQRLQMSDDIHEFARWSKAGESFPGTCVTCKKEVDVWDRWGLAWCHTHSGKQGALL